MIAFAFCLLYLSVVYIRPGEIVPAWAHLRIAATVLAAAGVAAVASLIYRPRRVANLPIDLSFFGFVLASILSSAASGPSDAAYQAFLDLVPLIGFYVVIRIAVQTQRHVRLFIGVLVLLTLFQAVNGIAQYWTGSGIGGATAVVEGPTDPDDVLVDGSDTQHVRRIRGTGIFGDPNDLAMSLVFVLPFLFSAVLSTDAGAVTRLLGLGTLATLSYALYLTQSRGGFLGLVVLGTAYAYRRFGRGVAVVAAVIVLVALLAAPGRLSAMSSTDESAQGRIQAWASGIEMLKAAPVLGIGFGRFKQFNDLAAHNSFVHVFAETGLVGIVCFVGMFYWFFVGNSASRNVAGAAESPLARDLCAACIGTVVCACFLSRQYVPVLYVPLALGAVRISVEQDPELESTLKQWWDWPLVLLLSIGVIMGTYLAVRTLAL